MIRKTLHTMIVTLVALFAVTALAEAAPKKVVHHRTRHSTRVSSGGTVTVKKKTVRKKAHGAVSKSTTRKTVTKRPPTTKPR